MDNFQLGGGKDFAFTHSKVAGQGLTQTKRIETASIVVAVDESGDFQNIQEAINSLNGKGGYIQLKEGDYKSTKIINVTSNITIEGVGYNTRVIRTTNGDIFDCGEGNSNIAIKNMRLRGTNVGENSGILLCSTEDSQIIGIQTEQLYSCVNGLEYCKRLLIANNISLDSNLGSGLYFESLEESTIINNHLYGENQSIDLYWCENNEIIGNQCNTAGDTAIYLDQYCSKNIISNNTCTSSSNVGILVKGDYNIINSNNCSNCFSNGIYLFTGSNNNIVTSNLSTILDSGTNTKANNINL